jgi:hypothetical protein
LEYTALLLDMMLDTHATNRDASTSFMTTHMFVHSVPGEENPLLRAPLLDFILLKMPQFIHTWRLTRHNTLCNLHGLADHCSLVDGILRRYGLDFDEHDSGIVWATIVYTIAKVA